MKNKDADQRAAQRPALEIPLIESHRAGSASRGDKVLGGSFSDAEHAPESLTFPDDQRFEHWCIQMGFTSALLAEWGIDRSDLKSLYQRDTTSSWLPCLSAHWFRPRSMTFLPERVWLALSMRPAWVAESLAHKPCWDPRAWVWIRGIAIPMEATKGYALKLMMSHLWQGAITGFKLTLHGILIISLGIQLEKVVHQRPGEIWSTLHNGDSETWKRLIYDATGTSARLFWPLIFAPTVVLAMLQMVLQTSRTLARGRGRLVHMATELIQRFEARSLWSSWIRPQLPLDPSSFMLITLTDQLAFDSRPGFTPDYRQYVTRYLITALRQTHGLYRLIALQMLAKLAIGTHIHNLNHGRHQPTSLTTATALSHLNVRLHAVQLLDTFMQTHPTSKREKLYLEWARYHGWMAGQKTHPVRIGAYLTMHVGLTAYFFYGFKVIIDAIRAYLDCPDKTGISMTGVASWSDDYTQPCFDAYLTFFRRIPGQPVSFLVDIIHRVHFTQKVMPLDLSYKGMNASDIRRVIFALAEQGISVSSLDLTGNMLATSEDYNLFMPLLADNPHLNTLILNNVGLESQATTGANVSATITLARWLPSLLNLQSLSIQGRWLGYNSRGTQALCAALAHCRQLRQFTLVSNLGWSSQQDIITLARALPQLTALRVLEVSRFMMRDSGAMALANAFMEMPFLEHLIMNNMASESSSVSTTQWMRALSYLESLKIMDFTNSALFNGAGTIAPPLWSQPASALANATLALEDLSSLKLNNTFLGYNGTGGGWELAQALSRRTKPLHVVELAINQLSAKATQSLNTLLTRWGLPTMPVQLRQAHETRSYLATLPPTQTHLTLDDGPQNDASLSALFYGIANSSILGLDLNGLHFQPTEEGFEGLANCTNLKYLRLSLETGSLVVLPLSTSTWLFFLNAISHLRSLQTLSLPGNFMLWDIAPLTLGQAFSNALSHIHSLTEVDLSYMGLGLNAATPVILEALAQQPRLKKLSLGGNDFGYEYPNASRALMMKLRHFPSLQSLTLGPSIIGEQEGVTQRLAQFLSTIDRPFYLNASLTKLGHYPLEAQELMIAIANNPHVSASLLAAGFGSQLWPPQVARLASATYDPYLRAACSNLQCFGIQPTLPDLGNSTRINFEQKHTPLWTAGPLFVIALLAMTLCIGIGYLLASRRRYTPLTRRRPVASTSIRPSPCLVSTQPKESVKAYQSKAVILR